MGNTPTAVIADDEPELRRYLLKILTQTWPELTILAEASNGQEALQIINEQKPDIAFLDINMPILNGLDVAKAVSNHCHVVFITAYDHYAVEAFNSAAIDYLLKPITEERLQKTISRLQTHFNTTPANLQNFLTQLQETVSNKQYLQWLNVAEKDWIQLLSVDEVDYFQANDKYTTVITRDKEWLIRTPLKELEVRLDPVHFWRIHRGTIVRVNAIKLFKKTFTGKHLIELHNHKQVLTVSRNYLHLFQRI